MKTLKYIVLLMTAAMLHAEDVVLYDAAVTPLSSVSQHSKSSYAVNNGVLEISTKGKTGYPGVLIKGKWDLSKCNRLSLEMVNRDKKGHLPITVRLDNPDAQPPGKSVGVFVDRIKIHGKAPKVYSVALPSATPHGREIIGKLKGMRRGPFTTNRSGGGP